jgi:O-antigen/teichoic acid export membrane protein
MVPFTYLGYYTFSLKLSKFAISVIAVINAITLPRLSNLFSLKEESKYYEFSNQLYNIYVYLSVPIATFLFIMAKDMVIAFAGSNFLPSVLTLRILSVTVVVSSIAYFTRFSILFVNQAESCYTISAIFASITCIIINFLLIPFLFQNATAIGNVVAEVVSLSIMCTLGKKYFNKVKLYNLEVVKTLLLSIILGIVLCVFKSFMTISSLQKIIVIVLIYAICYCAFSSFMKIEAYKFGCVRIRKLTSSVLKSVRGSSKTPV